VNQELERFVKVYGETYRSLIKDALVWLKRTEPHWKLDHPLDRDAFIADLIKRAHPSIRPHPDQDEQDMA
jgi:hypothetical protein